MTGYEATVKPLSGVTVLELSRVLTGPYAAMLLGDLGARVIKVERPLSGDDTRGWGPPFVGEGDGLTSTYFLSVNRNKESISLDLKDANDLKVLHGLLRKSDIVVENFKVGVLDKLGIGHDTMMAINPKLVIMSITGFGHDGPSAERPGYDQIVQGEAGLMSMTGDRGSGPTKVGLPIADLSAGLFGVIGALAALHERNSTGKGHIVRTSLLSAIVGLHTFQGARWLVGNEMPTNNGNAHPTVAPYGAYRAADEKLVQIAVGNEKLWKQLCTFLELDPADERFTNNASRLNNSAALNAIIDSKFGQYDSVRLISILDRLNIPAGVIKNLNDVYKDEQVLSQGLMTKAKHENLGDLFLPGTPIRWDFEPIGEAHRPPPTLNEHGADIREWALSESDQHG